jgi:hypothetical protein
MHQSILYSMRLIDMRTARHFLRWEIVQNADTTISALALN